MNKHFHILIITFLLCTSAHANRDTIPRWALALEVGGTGITNSLSLEYMLLVKRPVAVTMRAGISPFPFRIAGTFDWRSFGSFAELGGLIGQRRALLGLGIGFNYVYLYDNYYPQVFTNTDMKLVVTRLSFRHYSKSHSWFWELAYTPAFIVFNYPDKDDGTVWEKETIPIYGGIKIAKTLK